MFNIQDILDKVGLEMKKANKEDKKVEPIISIIVEASEIFDTEYSKVETEFCITGEKAKEDIEALAEVIEALKIADLDDIEDYIKCKHEEFDEDKAKALERIHYHLEFPNLSDNKCIADISVLYTDENGATTRLYIKE